ncbi:MAG: SMC-Scp complex subunit ScpB [Elusimicrobia bacterium]|nr:SMC-Scp complex subunit ScpB [Elusimicrobiota bacterium]
MDEMQKQHVKAAVEALLFVSDRPVTLDQIKGAIAGATAADIREALKSLMEECNTPARGMTILEIAGGFQMLSAQGCAGYIREFYKTRHKEKLSRPALETLAIIAYKQPVSRTDVELIRGVNSDGVVMHLLNKGLIKIAGRKEVPGRPYVYGTTTQFLEYFGLRSLEDLPKLEEFPALMAKTHEPEATPNPASEGVSAPVPPETEQTAGPQETEATLGNVPEDLSQEMAQARTRLDIDELEKNPETIPGFMGGEELGETSGQSRIMDAERPQGETEEVSDGPEDTAPED